MAQRGLAARGPGGEGNDDRRRLHEAPAWPKLRVHYFLAAGGVFHQQAQELAVPLDDTHVRGAGFVAGGRLFQVCYDPPHGVEGRGDLPLPECGTWQGGRENGEAVDRVDIGGRHGVVHDSHISRNAALARCKRDFTVPAGIPRAVAISCSLRPSRVRKTSTARCDGGRRARASSMSASPSKEGTEPSAGVGPAASSWSGSRTRRIAVRTVTDRTQAMIASGACSEGRPRNMASRASCVASSAAAGAIRAHNRRTYGASSSRSWSSASASPCLAAATFAGSTAARLPGTFLGPPPTFLSGRHKEEACPVEPDLTVVGAGVTGLTAAIEAAERGRRVVVAEAHSQPGGRARSLSGPFRANAGPHAIYVDGPWWAWLESRGLTPPIVEAPRHANLVRAGGQLGPGPAGPSAATARGPAGAGGGEPVRRL